MRHRARAATALAALLVSSGLLAGCTEDSPATDRPGGTPGTGTPGDPTAYDGALSTPVEDSVYPDVGDPGVDALHYDLDLTWDPQGSVLTGAETLTFRSTRTAASFQLDLGEPLRPGTVTLDGRPVEVEHVGKDLVVQAPVEEDGRHELRLTYAGTPAPVPAPTTRSDVSSTGWTITDDGSTWTMQEPYGAFTWYAVNDQPADKAFYDVTIHAPSPMVGVANGTLESRTETDGVTTTDWHLSAPAASYLTTVAISDYTMTTDTSAGGVPLTYWVPRGQDASVRRLRALAPGLDWLEGRLGPYPFDSLGVVLVDSESGMETQSMITLGTTDYATSPAVLVHEAAHQWYGDQVTPSDWRDVWMNEGMAMYLQWLWEADDAGMSDDATVDYWAALEPDLRRESGPPAAYDPGSFGESNIYFGPAVMWHELRRRIGDDAFFDLVRRWPSVDPDGSAGREEYLAWIEQRTGLELTSFFDSWLLGETSPARAGGG